MISLICETCKSPFLASPSRAKIRFTCSKKCLAIRQTTGKYENCLFCKVRFYARPSKNQSFCSIKCASTRPSYNKGVKGWANGGTYIKGHVGFRNEQNAGWKGAKAGMVALHAWVARYKGKPKKCEMCGTTEKHWYDWANISHEYKRELDDFMRLCRPCHRRYDYAYEGRYAQ